MEPPVPVAELDAGLWSTTIATTPAVTTATTATIAASKAVLGRLLAR